MHSLGPIYNYSSLQEISFKLLRPSGDFSQTQSFPWPADSLDCLSLPNHVRRVLPHPPLPLFRLHFRQTQLRPIHTFNHARSFGLRRHFEATFGHPSSPLQPRFDSFLQRPSPQRHSFGTQECDTRHEERDRGVHLCIFGGGVVHETVAHIRHRDVLADDQGQIHDRWGHEASMCED